VDIDHLTDGGVYDNTGISAAMRAFWYGGLSSRGCDILVSDASASSDWDTRSRFRNVVGRTIRSTEVLMKRVAELQLEVERLGPAIAHLSILKRRSELELDMQREKLGGAEYQSAEWKLKQLSEYPGLRWEVVSIDGSRYNSHIHLEPPHYNAFMTRWGPVIQYGAPVHSAGLWARTMASMRTDLDRFSTQERDFLESWGYEQARHTWPDPKKPPGARCDPIGSPPTEAELIQLEKSKRRKYLVIGFRDRVGIFLLVSWCLLFLLVIKFGSHLILYLFLVLVVIFGSHLMLRVLRKLVQLVKSVIHY
jgi:hypothetical protein